MPEFIDPVFTKTSPKRSFSVIQNERFGLAFAKTGSIISDTGFTTKMVKKEMNNFVVEMRKKFDLDADI